MSLEPHDTTTAPPLPPRAARVLAQAEARKRDARPPDARTYALACLFGRAVFGACLAPRVVGREHIPAAGPLLVAANHLSYLEPPLIATLARRRITFLARHELFEIGWLAPILQVLGALPVKRGGARDLDAIRAALDLLRQGEAVAIFPEGQRSPGPGLLRATPGVALLAHRSGAPILPIAVTGTERLEALGPFLRARWRPPPVRVTIGPPFHPDFGPGRPDHQAVADQILERIAALLPEAYRGEYGVGRGSWVVGREE